jgi:hypothetical protein
LISIYQTPILEWPEFIYYIPLAVGTFDIIVTEVMYFLRALAWPDRPPVKAAAPPMAG